jgi:hypothetical protein
VQARGSPDRSCIEHACVMNGNCRLAAIRHTQPFNNFTEPKNKNIIAARAAGCLTTVSDGVANGLRKTANTRRASTVCCCSAQLAAHFAKQPAGTTTNSEEGGSLLGFHGRKWGSLDRES